MAQADKTAVSFDLGITFDEFDIQSNEARSIELPNEILVDLMQEMPAPGYVQHSTENSSVVNEIPNKKKLKKRGLQRFLLNKLMKLPLIIMHQRLKGRLIGE